MNEISLIVTLKTQFTSPHVCVVFIFCRVRLIVWCIKRHYSFFVSNPDRLVNILELTSYTAKAFNEGFPIFSASRFRGNQSAVRLFMLITGNKVRTIVTLVPAEQARYQIKLRIWTLTPTLVVLAKDLELLWYMKLFALQCACLNFETMEMIGRLKIKVCSDELNSTINGIATLLYPCSMWSRSICTSQNWNKVASLCKAKEIIIGLCISRPLVWERFSAASRVTALYSLSIAFAQTFGYLRYLCIWSEFYGDSRSSQLSSIAQSRTVPASQRYGMVRRDKLNYPLASPYRFIPACRKDPRLCD